VWGFTVFIKPTYPCCAIYKIIKLASCLVSATLAAIFTHGNVQGLRVYLGFKLPPRFAVPILVLYVEFKRSN
jgi:hypothetical protein